MASGILTQSGSPTPPRHSAKPSVYDIITEKIVAQLEQGVVPWRKPWAASGTPVNLATGRQYRGINVMLLSCAGHSSPYWMTYKQAQEMGGHVRKGEKSTAVVFWKWLELDSESQPETEREPAKSIPFLRYYSVFNVEQIEGIPASKIPARKVRTIQPVAAAEAIVDAMPNRPAIGHGGDRALYRPSTDSVQMPNPDAFDSAEAYHSTLFHELTHATGHPSRLGRLNLESDLAPFGSPDYSREELVAEMGAAFLCAEAGIENATLTNSVAYIQNWLHALRNDKRMVVIAAAQAQRAADFILNRKAHEAVESAVAA